MSRAKKFLVLGATGTLGSAVAAELEAQGAVVVRIGHHSPESGLQCNVADHRSVHNLVGKVQEAIGEGEKLDGVFYGVSRHSFAECQHALRKGTEAYEQTPALVEMLSVEVIGLQIVLEQFASMIHDGGKFAVATPVFAQRGFGDPIFWEALEAARFNLDPFVALKRMQAEWFDAWKCSRSCNFAIVGVPARLIAEGPITGIILEEIPERFYQRVYTFAQVACRQMLED